MHGYGNRHLWERIPSWQAGWHGSLGVEFGPLAKEEWHSTEHDKVTQDHVSIRVGGNLYISMGMTGSLDKRMIIKSLKVEDRKEKTGMIRVAVICMSASADIRKPC